MLLVDADIVIHCHQLGIWRPDLLQKLSIAVPGIVASEARFFYSKKQGKQIIDLPKQISDGVIACLDGTVDEFNSVIEPFVEAFSEAIHDGEKEGLGLLLGGRFPDLRFCTGDTNAIQASAMLGISDSMCSLERMIYMAGLQKQIKVTKPSMTEESFKYHTEVGKTRRITREYFKA